MTGTQFRILRESMPEIWARWHYPIAQLTSLLANWMGGKPDPAKPSENTIPPERLYRPDDFMPWYARFGGVRGWTERALIDAVEHAKDLPGWARRLVPWDQAERLKKRRPAG